MLTSVILGKRILLSGIVAIGVVLGNLPTCANASAPPVHVRGTIENATATTLKIRTSEGLVVVTLVPSTVIAGIVPALRSDIKPNAFIGVTNAPRLGVAARALGVFILPDALRNESGNFNWDFPSAGNSGSRMTNGTVSQGSRMTNGTVSNFSNSGPLTVTVTYKGGSIDTTIPANTQIVRVLPASATILKPGVHVFVALASTNGHTTAAQIVAGEQGLTPPM